MAGRLPLSSDESFFLKNRYFPDLSNDLILPHYADGMKKAIMQEFQSYAMAMQQIA